MKANIENNYHEASKATLNSNCSKSIQSELLQMGFDMVMINKIIFSYSVKTTIEALSYLLKTDGMWNHSFISKYQQALSLSSSNGLCDICGEGQRVHRWLGQKDNEDCKRLKEQCGICMSDIEDPVELPGCSHTFCSECLKGYIANLITYNQIESIRCPKANCNCILNEEFFIRFIPQEAKAKYDKFKSMNQIAKDSNKLFCPLCDGYALKRPQSVSSIEKYSLQCVNGHLFCSCGRPEHLGQCDKDSEELNSFIKSEKIKKCPMCGFFIYKNQGCNHLTCGNPMCNYEFCWLCMKEYSDEHYKDGECKNMEFINGDGLLFKMRKHPFLFKVLSFFNSLFVWSLLIIRIVATVVFPIPFVAMPIYSYYIKENHRLVNAEVKLLSIKPKTIDFAVWLIGIVLSFGLLPLYYVCLLLIVGIVCAVVAISPIGVLIGLLFLLVKRMSFIKRNGEGSIAKEKMA